MLKSIGKLWKVFTTSRAIGLLLAAVSGFFHTFSSSLVQFIFKTVPNVTTPEVLLVRCLIELTVVLIVMVSKRISPIGSGFYLVLLGFAGTGHMVFLYYALKYIPVGDVTVMLLTVPVFTLLLSYALFKKGCSAFNFAFGALSIFGVILIANPTMIFHGARHTEIRSPSFHLMAHSNRTLVEQSRDMDDMTKQYLLGTCFAMLGAASTAIYYILCKYAVSIGDSIFLTIFYPGIFGVITSIIMIVSKNQAPTILFLPISDVLLLITVGMLTTLSIYLMTCGLDLDDAGPVVLIRNFDVIYGYFFQFLLLGYHSSSYTMVGALIVVFSTLMVVLNRELDIDQKYCCGKFLTKDNDERKEKASVKGSHAEAEVNEPLLSTAEK